MVKRHMAGWVGVGVALMIGVGAYRLAAQALSPASPAPAVRPLFPGAMGDSASQPVLPFASMPGLSTGAMPTNLFFSPITNLDGMPPFFGAPGDSNFPAMSPFMPGLPSGMTSPTGLSPSGLFAMTNVAPGSLIMPSAQPPSFDSSVGTNESSTVPDVTGLETQSMDVLVGLKFENLELDEVLKQYSDWTGLAIMKAPDAPAVKLTLKCPRRLPKREALLAIEGMLAMHGVGLVSMGDKFLKVVPIAAARQHGISTGTGPLEKELTNSDHLVSRIVELKFIESQDAIAVINSLKHPYGQVMALDRVNCLLITETAVNLKRIQEVLEMIDLPIESREALRIFKIKYAKASEIQSKIEAIIADTQGKDKKNQPQRTTTFQPPQTQRPNPMQPFQPVQQPISQSSVLDGSSGIERGLIQGRVKMVSDDRINSLIVITSSNQFRFFENMIEALDQKIEPEVSIKVFVLEYALSKDVVSVLNSLVGSAAAVKTPTAGATPSAQPTSPSAPLPVSTLGAASASRDNTPGEIMISGKLASDVKIIADPRINALLVMASKTDMITIEDVLKKIDIMLSQVLVEVVIFELGLSDNVRMGVDWLQRSMIAYNNKANGARKAIGGFAGTSKEMDGGNAELRNPTIINTIGDNVAAAGSGLTYYFTYFDYNIDAVINMLASSAEAKILSMPVILTTDNKQAKILVGEKRPIVNSTSISGGGVQQSSYQYTDIGISLDVTPHINKKGFVVMDIKQKIDNKGEDVIIDGNRVPVITTRDFSASIAVNDGRSIVIGGMMSSDQTKSRSKIPFLGDIPLLGALFRSDSTEDKRRELLVLITPYVLDNPQRVYQETSRRFNSMREMSNTYTKGWSEGELAKESTKDAKARKKEEEKAEAKRKNASEKKAAKPAASATAAANIAQSKSSGAPSDTNSETKSSFFSVTNVSVSVNVITGETSAASADEAKPSSRDGQ